MAMVSNKLSGYRHSDCRRHFLLVGLAPLAFASHAYDDFHLLMPLFACRVWRGSVTPQEGQETAWVRPARLRDYAMPPADEPLVAIIRDYL